MTSPTTTGPSTRGPSGCWRSSCPGVKLVGNITTGVVLLYGGYRVLHGEMTIGMLAAFLLYLRMFFEPMQEISQFFNTFQSASSALEKLAGVLAEQPAIRDPAAAGDAAPTCAATSSFAMSGSPTCRIARCCPIFADGPGGADRRAGRHHRRRQDDDRQADRPVLRPDVRVGDTRRRGPARPRRRPTLRRHVVMVTQENFMFDGTVADNIRFGRPDATDDEVRCRCSAVGRRPVHRRAARRLRHRRRQARRPAVGGAAAAGRVRPGVPRRPGGADPRRGDVVAGHSQRAAGAARAADDPGRPHRADHRAPAVDGGDRRPGAGARARPDRRGRAARGPDRAERRPLRRAAPRVDASRWPSGGRLVVRGRG